MNSKVILISPPLFDTRAPHLACPVLASALQQAGHQVEIRDLNIEGINWLLSPAEINRAVAKAKEKRNTYFAEAEQNVEKSVPISPARRYGLWRSLSTLCCRDGFSEQVSKSLKVLRHPEMFYDAGKHYKARHIINNALNLHAFVCDDQLQVSIFPQQYHSRYSVSSLQDLLLATDHESPNIFAPFFNQCVGEIERAKPDFVGISISNVFQAIPGLTLARRLFERGIYTIIGGTFFSKFRDRLQELPRFFELCNLVVISEGEEVIRKIADEGIHAVDLKSLPNVIFVEDGKVVATETMLNDEVPNPIAADFRTLDWSAYHSPDKVLPIYHGKGCAWGKCTFCEIPQINRDFGRWRRVRTTEMVLHEIEVQKERHGASHFIFTDEDIEAKRLGLLADGILARNLDVSFICYTRFTKHHTAELFNKLAKAGCRKLLFGLESGSQIVNDACNKGVDLKLVPTIVENCQNAGIALHIFSISGLPEETEEEARVSEEYITRLIHKVKLPTSSYDISPFYLNWNSSLRRSAEQYGVIYTNEFDFPINFKDYEIKNGVNHQEASNRARALYQNICFERSPLTIDVNYANPFFPMWEEYTLLYLAKFGNQGKGVYAWPGDLKTVLQLKVTPCSGLKVEELPFDVSALPNGGLAAGHSTLLSSPSAKILVLPPEIAELIAACGRVTIQLLMQQLMAHGRFDSAAAALGLIIQLLKCNLLTIVSGLMPATERQSAKKMRHEA